MSQWKRVALIQSEIVHIGEKQFSGGPLPQGRSWRKWFKVNALPNEPLYFLVSVWHTDSEHNEVFLNNQWLGNLQRSSGDKFRYHSLPIADGVLSGGDNSLLIQAGSVDGHGHKVDDFLISKLSIVRRASGTPNVGSKERFFRSIDHLLRAKGWRSVSIDGFEWCGIKGGYPGEWLFRMFDADSSDMLEGAHLKLSRWADDTNGPKHRLAIAVYDNATRANIEYITKELQKGTRMDKQSMSGVIHLRGLQFFSPKEGSGYGFQRISFNTDLGRELAAAIQQSTAPR